MKLIKILAVYGIAIVLIIVGIPIWYKARHYNQDQQLKQAIMQSIDRQFDVGQMVFMDFYDYSSAIDQYLKSPDASSRKRVDTIAEKLDKSLTRATHTFDLPVTRWVNLFRASQVTFQQQLFTSPQRVHPLTVDRYLLFYGSIINDAIRQAQQRYQNESFNDLLYTFGVNASSQLPSPAQREKIYTPEVKALIPEYAVQLAKLSPLECSTPSFTATDPKKIAQAIVWLQYQSRYCPQQIDNRLQTDCRRLKRLTPQQSVVCAIAKERLANEAAEADKKYGDLTYSAYYDQYVRPLIPHYVNQLKQAADSNQPEKVVMACNTDLLPVVAFRDPRVDAQTAAYALTASQVCQLYFKVGTTDLTKLQDGLDTVNILELNPPSKKH